MDRFIQYAVAAAQMAVDDAAPAIARRGRRERVGVVGRRRHGRHRDHRGVPSRLFLESGAEEGVAVLHPAAHRQHGARPHRHSLRRQGRELRDDQRLRLGGHADRRGLPSDPLRVAGRDARRRRRGGGAPRSASAASRRCARSRRATTSRSAPAVRSTASATASSSPKAPACWCSRRWSTPPAAARASTPSSSATAPTATPTTSPRRRRKGEGAARCMRLALRGRRHRPARRRLHQRARHLDAVQRRQRDAGDQARLRRARRARSRSARPSR